MGKARGSIEKVRGSIENHRKYKGLMVEKGINLLLI